MKRQSETGKIFANHILNKELVSTVYKVFLQEQKQHKEEIAKRF